MRPSAPWLVSAVGSRLRRTVWHPPYPQLLLVLVIGAVYLDSLWGVPRWDQLVYLYEASQFDSPLEVLAHSPSWNRTVSLGDHVLFRPILYLFLAVQYILFDRSFFLWQATGIALHATQSLLLYRFLGRVSPRTPAPNLVVAVLFSSLLISSPPRWLSGTTSPATSSSRSWRSFRSPSCSITSRLTGPAQPTHRFCSRSARRSPMSSGAYTASSRRSLGWCPRSG